MGLLQCPLCCHSQQQHDHHQQQESQPHSNHLHSESSTSSSLSSQPSLPSVPSLTLQQSHYHHPEPPRITAHHQLLTTIKGHSSPIFSLALHGKFLYSGSSNSEIRTCRRDPFALQSSNNNTNTTNNSSSNVEVAISNGAVKSMIVLMNDKLITAHQDHKIRVWKIENNDDHIQNQRHYYKCIATLPTFNDRFSKLFSSKNYVEVRRHKKCTWVHHVDTVSALALSHDGSLLYSASWDRTFKIWRTSDFKCLESVRNAHEDAINALALSRDGFVYTGSADKKIKIWKKGAGEKKHKLLGTLEKHKSAVNALALSIDGSVLYSGACDRSILVWEKKEDSGGCDGESETNNNTMVLVGALRGHTKAILCLVVVSDLVCSGSADNSVRIWRRSSGVDEKSCYSCLAVLEGHRKPVKCLAVAVDSNSANYGGDGGGGPGGDGDDNNRCSSYLVYSGSLDCDIRIWKIRV